MLTTPAKSRGRLDREYIANVTKLAINHEPGIPKPRGRRERAARRALRYGKRYPDAPSHRLGDIWARDLGLAPRMSPKSMITTEELMALGQ